MDERDERVSLLTEARTTTDPARQRELLAGGRSARAGLSMNPSCSRDVLEALLEGGGQERANVVARAGFSADELSALSADEDVRVREAVAGRDDLPGGVLEVLLADPHTSVRKAAARSSRLSTAMAREILAGDDTTLLYALSTGSNLDPEHAALVSLDRRGAVSAWLARNVVVVPDGRWSLAWLRRHGSERLEELLSAAARERGVERSTLDVLARTWEGSVDDLVSVARGLGPEVG